MKGSGKRDIGNDGGYVVGLRDEDRIGCTFKAGEDVRAKVLRSSVQSRNGECGGGDIH